MKAHCKKKKKAKPAKATYSPNLIIWKSENVIFFHLVVGVLCIYECT